MYAMDGGAGTPADLMGPQDLARMPVMTTMNDRSRQHMMMMMNSGQPSPTNPSAISNDIANLARREAQVNSNIQTYQSKVDELQVQLNSMSGCGPAPRQELQQQIYNVKKQLQASLQQQQSIRSQLNNAFKSGGNVGRPISGTGGNPGLDLMGDTQRMMGDMRLGQNAPPFWRTPGGKEQRIWLVFKDIPSSSSVDMIKYALESSGTANYEMHPNVTARWCLVGLGNQNDAQRLVAVFQAERQRIGNVDVLTPNDAMNYLQVSGQARS
ncbi:hypothetical protein Ciccas_008924 [Cichlidogyrus casuarinus]|uniref:Uncharacterized protein n=1 Tax=Cichlidogyrus casuarinus TaxID=1844966 RepID=A0ABD2PZX7_9PLAT